MGEGAGELGMLGVAVHSGTCSVNSVRLIYRWARDETYDFVSRAGYNWTTGQMWSAGLEFDMSVSAYPNPLGPFKFPNAPHSLLYLDAPH